MNEWDVRVARESRLRWWTPRVYVVIVDRGGEQDRLSVDYRWLAEALAEAARDDLRTGRSTSLATLYLELTT